MGPVSLADIVKPIGFAYVPEAQPDACVVMHAGFAIAAVSEAHALDARLLRRNRAATQPREWLTDRDASPRPGEKAPRTDPAAYEAWRKRMDARPGQFS